MRARIFLAFLPLLAPFLAGVADAQPSGAVPLDRLLPQIRRNVPGQFLDAEGISQGGSPHYHLKWLTPDGRVMWLDADARTGRVLGQSPGRDNFDGQRLRADEQTPPLDRREEGRSTTPRDQDDRRYRQPPDAPARQRFNGDGVPYRNYQQQYRRFGGDRGSSGGNDDRFGGHDFGDGSRGFGGGRDRRGDGR